jgi:hypothetical protein
LWANWRLPTLDELSDVYNAPGCTSTLSLEPDWYWSSTEIFSDYVRRQNMSNGNSIGYGKYSDHYVVCVYEG